MSMQPNADQLKAPELKPGSKPANLKPPHIASASVPDTLAALHVNSETVLTHVEVEVRLGEHVEMSPINEQARTTWLERPKGRR